MSKTMLAAVKPEELDSAREIVRTQHLFERVVSSTLRFHLEKHRCPEIIAVEGDTQEIRKLAETLAAKKGVQQVKVASVAP